MKTCLACQDTIDKLNEKLGYCQTCITESVHLQSLCIKCSSPLKNSSPRCAQCGQRHGMASCGCCGEALFKHSSYEVTHSSWRELPMHGSGVNRIFRWLGQPKRTEVFYLHPQCIGDVTERYKGAIKIADIDFDYVLVEENSNLDTLEPQDLSKLVSQSASSRGTQTAISVENSVFQDSKDITAPQTSHVSTEWLSEWISHSQEEFSQIVQPYQTGKRHFESDQLQGISLDSQALVGVLLNSADLSRCNFNACDLSESDFSDAIADYAKIDGSSFKVCLFRNTSLRDSKVLLSNFTQADFYKADLRRTDFYSSNLHRANFTLSNLTETKLDGANLSLSCCLLANFSNASLIETNLTAGNLEQANLSGANLSWASLNQVVASKTNLQNAILQHSDLTDIDLSEANLQGTDFLNTNLSQAHSLKSATYNSLTRFPEDFKPESWGMIRLETE